MIEIQEYLEKKNKIQNYLIDFIDNGINFKDDVNLISLFNEEKIGNNPSELKALLHLISNISSDHHRSIDFFKKIDQILFFFGDEIKLTFSNFEIFQIFIKNKRILLFLFKNKIILPDKYITSAITHKKFLAKNYHFYFYPEIKDFLSEECQQEYKCELLSTDPDKFEQKRKIGENDNYICQLIQNDSINEFVIYLNKTNLPLTSKIELSIFETNTYLLNNHPTLIKYSAFFGSIQIFKYLISKGVELPPSIWIYAIHGGNMQIIQILRDNQIDPKDDSYKQCFKEAIRFHNNNLANFLRDNFFKEPIENDSEIFMQCLKYYNFNYFPHKLENTLKMLYNLCQYDYIHLVELLLKSKTYDINGFIKISKNFFLFNAVSILSF